MVAVSAQGSALPVPDMINDVRRGGCGELPPAARMLAYDFALDRVAARLHANPSLEDALARNRYRARQSATIRLSGFVEPAARAALARQFCATVMNPTFTTVGYSQRGSDLWIVLALPFDPPAPTDLARIADDALRLVNEARSSGVRCGARRMPGVGKLVASAPLQRAAQEHATDMARRGVLTHEGADGSTVASRATRAGYSHRVIGENVAGGPVTAAAVVREWLNSPGHCENLMDPRFTQMGIAYAVNAAAPLGIYWSQVLGTPR